MDKWPFPCGSWPDIKIFRERRIHALPQGEKSEADMGYRGKPAKIDLPEENIFCSNTQRVAKALVRSRHEACNRRFKQWSSLSLIFRHDKKTTKLFLILLQFWHRIQLTIETNSFLSTTKQKHERCKL